MHGARVLAAAFFTEEELAQILMKYAPEGFKEFHVTICRPGPATG